jgi:type IV pilus assembly protein PilM
MKMAKKITTLFVRDNGIYLAVLNGQRIEKWAFGQLEPGLVKQGLVTDEPKVSAAVRDLMQQHKISGGKAVVGVSGVNSLYRMITLPEMPDSLLGEAVRREAKRVLPVSLDDVYLSYQEVPAVSKGEKRIFLTTYPRNNTDAMVRTARQAGLMPYLMDLAPLALSRIPDEPRSIIVNARGDYADIIVVEDRIPQLIRVLALPAEAGSIIEKLPGITEELNRTIIFYNSSHTEKPLNQSVPLFVSGELSENQDVWPRLVGRLNFPVSAFPATVEVPADLKVDDFMVNIGLALKEFGTERAGTGFSTINLNILPAAYHPKRVPLSSVLVPVFIVVGLGIIAYVAVLVYQASQDTKTLRQQVTSSQAPIVAQTKKIADLKAEVDKLTPQNAPVDAQVAQLNATAAIYTSTLDGVKLNRETIYTDLHDKVVGKLPGNKESLGLTSINDDGNSVNLSGVALDESYIFTYARDLRSTGYTTVVSNITAVDTVDPETSVTSTTYTFNLLLK